MNKHILNIAALPACTATLLLTSCKEKGEIHHFRTPKAAKTPATTPAAPNAAQPNKPSYTWHLPEGWTAKPASGMRLATILIPTPTGTLNASLTEFGGDLAGNVNRWRKQLGLPTLAPAAVTASLTPVQTGLGNGYITTQANPATPDANALLAAIIPRPGGTSVFLKVLGTPAQIKAITPAFTTFTRSLAISAPSPE